MQSIFLYSVSEFCNGWDMEERTLSPCVQSALRNLPEEVTAWEFVEYLFGLHPEYVTDQMRRLFPVIDASYEGEFRSLRGWLRKVEKMYPEDDFLDSGMVIVALMQIDPDLNDLVPQDVIEEIEDLINLEE